MRLLVAVVVALLLAALSGAQSPSRFWASDFSVLGESQRAYLIHDQKRPNHCVLVIQTNQQPGGYSMLTAAAVPWDCQ